MPSQCVGSCPRRFGNVCGGARSQQEKIQKFYSKFFLAGGSLVLPMWRIPRHGEENVIMEQKLPDDERTLGVEQVPVGAEQPQEARKEEPEMRIFDFRIRRAQLRQDLKVQDDNLTN